MLTRDQGGGRPAKDLRWGYIVLRRVLLDRRRGQVVKGMGHLDHVWSYGVRKVVSLIPDRGNIL